MNMFQVGDKIVCVHAEFDDSWDVVANRPVKNGVYTVRAVCIQWYTDYLVPSKSVQGVGVYLAEVVNPPQPFRRVDTGERTVYEVAFSARRFRPLIVTKTDISVFERLLNTKSEDELIAG